MNNINSARCEHPSGRQLTSIASGPSREIYSGRVTLTGPPTFPGMDSFRAFWGLRDDLTHRGRRKRPLSPSTKAKASRVRKSRACFRCQILRVACDEQRPCAKCKVGIASSKHSVNFRWMDCIVLSLLEHSIYPLDSPAQMHMPPSHATLCSMLDEIHLSHEWRAGVTLDFLAEDFAKWISHSNSSISLSKIGVLCASNFQVIAGRVLEDSFVKNFRLLLWTTTLDYTACTAKFVNSQHPDEALSNLRMLRNFYGARVIRTIDKICRPQYIQRLSKLQRKLLFLMIAGICLSVTYSRDSHNNLASSSRAAPASLSRPLDPQSRVFVRALAHICTYLGHETELLGRHVDSCALLEAAERRWDYEGSYSWQIPPLLAKKLTTELFGELYSSVVNISGSPQGVEENYLSLEPGNETTSHAQGDMTSSLIPPERSEKNACIECLQNGRLCEFCEFMNLPDSQYVLISVEQLNGDHITEDNQRDSLFPSPRTSVGSRTPVQSPKPPSHSLSDQWSIAGSTVHNSYAEYRASGKFWYCCMCGDGPKLNIQVACCACHHKVCSYCESVFV